MGDFTAFCDREYPAVLGALTLWCGDRDTAEEVTAEAFARAWRDWHRVSDLESPGGWVRRVAINLATSAFRRRQAERRAKHRLQHRARTAHRDPDSAEVVAVRRALQTLAPDHRTVIVLRHYLDLPVDEVAGILGRSPTAVTSLTSRATEALRAALEAEGMSAPLTGDTS